MDSDQTNKRIFDVQDAKDKIAFLKAQALKRGDRAFVEGVEAYIFENKFLTSRQLWRLEKIENDVADKTPRRVPVMGNIDELRMSMEEQYDVPEHLKPGKKHGFLTIVSIRKVKPKNPAASPYWFTVQCDCGNTREFCFSYLWRNGKIQRKTCGAKCSLSKRHGCKTPYYWDRNKILELVKNDPEIKFLYHIRDKDPGA